MNAFIRMSKTRPLLQANMRLNFSTTPTKNIPPILVALIKPASRIFAAVLGRRFRLWWKKLPEQEKHLIRQKTNKNGRFIGGLGFFLSVLALYGYESHIEECPITKSKRFVALRKDQMEKISSAEFDQLLSGYKEQILPDNHPAYDRVARVVTRILRSNLDMDEMKGKNWTISVIDEADNQNAFVLPTGNIFVFSGMLNVCTNDDQLGIVLSHEVAHSLLNHAAENLSHINLLSALMIIPLAVAWAFLPNDGIAIVADWFFNQVSTILWELPFARHMETEADEVGLKLASKACFDVREAPVFWAKMQVVSEMSSDFEQPEFLSTHPSHETREKHLAALVPDALQMRSSCGCYKLPSSDPSQHLQSFILAMRREAARKQAEARAKKPRIVIVRD